MKDEANKRTTSAQGSDAPDVARAYDRWAASYDADSNATRDLDAEVVRRAPLVLDGRDVLELGCGTGKNTAWLAARARSVVGLDFSAGMLARGAPARRRGARPLRSARRSGAVAGPRRRGRRGRRQPRARAR